jgi:transposase IS116/IS110/IS902 family protein
LSSLLEGRGLGEGVLARELREVGGRVGFPQTLDGRRDMLARVRVRGCRRAPNGPQRNGSTWPGLQIPARALTGGRWQDRVAGRLARAEQTARVRIARDELRRIRALTRSIDALERELAVLVAELAPRLLAERGCGVLTAAKLIGEIAGIGRFTTDAKLARIAGSAPIPASSGHTDRHRLDRGGNRQLNCALHRLAVTKGRLDPDTAAYLARKQSDGKSRREALRCLKRHLARRVWRLLQPPPAEPSPSPSTRPPTLPPAGITIHCNTPYSRLSLT